MTMRLYETGPKGDGVFDDVIGIVTKKDEDGVVVDAEFIQAGEYGTLPSLAVRPGQRVVVRDIHSPLANDVVLDITVRPLAKVEG